MCCIDIHLNASLSLRMQSDELLGLWEELELLSADKGMKLQEASEEQLFLRSVNDFDLWIDEVGKALASDDLGKVYTIEYQRNALLFAQ